MDLYNWSFETRRGYIYCVGEFYNGKLWQTSPVVSLETRNNCYKVVTENSTYYLNW